MRNLKRFFCVVVLALLLPFVVSSQSTWSDFDNLITSLQSEIDNLNSQILSIQTNLMQSQIESETLKQQLKERETAYSELSASLVKSKQSLSFYEKIVIPLAAILALSIGFNVYQMVH